MFGIGMPELLLILALAIIIIGPKKLPDIARALGRGLAEFRRATDELKYSITEETRAAETREKLVKEGKIRAPGADPALAADESSAKEAETDRASSEGQGEDDAPGQPPEQEEPPHER